MDDWQKIMSELFSNKIIYPSLDSTNKEALRIKETTNDTVVIIAHEQTSGKGRGENSWMTPKGDVAMSILIQKPHLPTHVTNLPMITAMSICSAIKDYGIDVKLKWPNDIILLPKDYKRSSSYFGEYKKLGGILLETIFFNNQISAVIIGVGLNVVENKTRLQAIPHAISLADQGVILQAKDLIESILFHLEKELYSETDDVTKRYITYCESINRTVKFNINNKPVVGRAVGINKDGALLIHSNGKTHTIYAGDVQLYQ